MKPMSKRTRAILMLAGLVLVSSAGVMFAVNGQTAMAILWVLLVSGGSLWMARTLRR